MQRRSDGGNVIWSIYLTDDLENSRHSIKKKTKENGYRSYASDIAVQSFLSSWEEENHSVWIIFNEKKNESWQLSNKTPKIWIDKKKNKTK